MDLAQFRDKRLFKPHEFFKKHEWVLVREKGMATLDLPLRMKFGMHKWLRNKKNRNKRMYVCMTCRALGEMVI